DKLTEDHKLQIRKQGLYGRLALAYLSQAEALESPGYRGETAPPARLSWQQPLRKALIHAQRAVEWNPQGAEDFLVLGRVYAVLGDWCQATEQWEKTLRLGPTFEALSTIASAYFPELAKRADLGDHPPADPERRHQFLRKALSIVESQALAEEDGVSQMQAHGNLHFCLGCSHFALQEFAEAISHLTIAKGLGCRPIDTRVALADAWLQSRESKGWEAKAQAELKAASAEASNEKEKACVEECRKRLRAVR
ncbi:MAG TPA: hypothetical protein VGQ28_14660, partial [Thermoanaerobaculia bacterium]|nr:hypothetical protein [Thermoanaerobaculia bacterium]